MLRDWWREMRPAQSQRQRIDLSPFPGGIINYNRLPTNFKCTYLKRIADSESVKFMSIVLIIESLSYFYVLLTLCDYKSYFQDCAYVIPTLEEFIQQSTLHALAIIIVNNWTKYILSGRVREPQHCGWTTSWQKKEINCKWKNTVGCLN